MSEKEKTFRKRTQWIVDRTLQSRFVATWLMVAFWIAFGLALTYIAGAWAYFQLYEDPSTWTDLDMRRAMRFFVAGNIVFILFLIALIGLSALIHSHRIAGASFRMKDDLRKFRDGNHSVQIRLRRTDYLHDLADALNETLGYIRTRLRDQERQLELAKDLATSLEGAALPDPIKDMAREIGEKIVVAPELPLEPIDAGKDTEDDD